MVCETCMNFPILHYAVSAKEDKISHELQNRWKWKVMLISWKVSSNYILPCLSSRLKTIKRKLTIWFTYIILALSQTRVKINICGKKSLWKSVQIHKSAQCGWFITKRYKYIPCCGWFIAIVVLSQKQQNMSRFSRFLPSEKSKNSNPHIQ